MSILRTTTFFVEKIATILFLPCLEYGGLRYFVRHILGIRLGFRFGTDYNLVFPALLGAALYLGYLHERGVLNLRLRPPALRRNLLLLAIFAAATFWWRAHISYSGSRLGMGLWFATAAAVLLTSSFVFIRASELFPRRFWPVLAGAGLVTACDSLALLYLTPIAQPLTRATTTICAWVLAPFMPSLQGGQVADYSLLMHPRFTIAVGNGCSGLEGMLLLLAVFLFYVFTRPGQLRRGQVCLYSLAALAFMFLVNVARMAVFLAVAIWATRRWGGETGLTVILTLFHNLVDWIVYSIAFVGFFHIFWRGRVSSESQSVVYLVTKQPA